MAQMAEYSEFWPPPEFLTDYEILMGKTNNARKNGIRAEFPPNLCFPTEFPFDFGSSASSSALNSPVDSAMGSTESESDDDDLLAVLTRQLSRSTLQETQKLSSAQKNLEGWATSGSPKSTLPTVGSWSGRSTVSSNGRPKCLSRVPSPPTFPMGTNDAFDLIYEAARLKMSGGGAVKPGGVQCPTQIHSSLVHSLPSVRNPNFAIHSNQRTSHTLSQMNHGLRLGQIAKQQGSDCWGLHAKEAWLYQNQVGQNQVERLDGIFSDSGSCGRRLCLSQTPWPGLQAENNCRRQCQNQQLQSNGSEMRPTFLGGSDGVVAKRERAGTGVFLPRRHNNPIESRKQGRSTAMIPAKFVPAHPQCLAPPFFNGASIQVNDLMVQRNAMLVQQKPDSATGQEIYLPQEWTY